jgi:nickel-type superoxide dismutase maturation protease
MHPPFRHATKKEMLLCLLRRYRRFRVTGNSMLPLLVPGSEVLLDPWAYADHSPTPTDVVVADHPTQPGLRIIKRVEFVSSDGRCYLKGDNMGESSDSRQFGLVPTSKIRGKVMCLFP